MNPPLIIREQSVYWHSFSHQVSECWSRGGGQGMPCCGGQDTNRGHGLAILSS